MKKIFFMFGLAFNFCFFAQAQDSTGLAKAWVQSRFPACQNPQAAAELINEFSKGTLAGLVGAGKPCADRDLSCFRKIDSTLDSLMRKYYLRLSVRCTMEKVAFNYAYTEATQKEGLFGVDKPKPLPVESSDYNATVPPTKGGPGGAAPPTVPARR